MTLRRFRNITVKCDLKKNLRSIWDYSVSLVAHSRSGDGLIILILICSTGYLFSSISIFNYFPLLLWGALYIWLYSIWPRNWYRGPATNPLTPIFTIFTITIYPPFSSSVLRSSYLLVLYSWLCSIRLSYGIDNSTSIILRFNFDIRTITCRRPFVDIVLG